MLDLGSDMHGNGNGVGGNMVKSGRYRGFGSLLEMGMELGGTWGRVGDIEVLEACLKAAWGSIPQERLDSLIRSTPARLQAAIDAEGGAMPY